MNDEKEPDDSGAENETPEESMEDTIRASMAEVKGEPNDEPDISDAEKQKPEAGAVEGSGKEAPATPLVENAARAPSSWKAEAALEWSKVPPSVQAEIQRREDDFHKGLQSYKETADFGASLKSEFAPYEAVMRADGIAPQQLIRNLLNTAYQLRAGNPEQKRNVIAGLAQHYGVDLGVAQQQGAVQHVEDPRVNTLQQQVQGLTQQLTERQQREQAEVSRKSKETIDAFAKSPERAEYFPLVRTEMAALLESGIAKTLEEAYDKAILLVPPVREKILAQQQEITRKTAEEKVKAAKRAAANAKPKGSLPSVDLAGSMEETIRAELRKRA